MAISVKTAWRKTALVACAGTLVLSGCATTGGEAAVSPPPKREAHAGFLSEYAKLRPLSAPGNGSGWLRANVDWRQYDKILIERIQVYLKPGDQQAPVDPTELKALVDYFHDALVKSLSAQARIVDRPGPGVLRVRIAITDLVPTGTTESMVATLVPYAFVADIASGAASGRPRGSTPYLGETGIEAQFRDGVSGEVLGEYSDLDIGVKYNADIDSGVTSAAKKWVNGYVDSFTAWAYAERAFDQWAALFAQRFLALREMRGGS